MTVYIIMMYVHTPSSLKFDLVAFEVGLVFYHLDKRLEKRLLCAVKMKYIHPRVEFHR